MRSFPALDGLVDLANRDHIDISSTLLRVLTDLYVSKPRHTSEEERQYSELALRLLDKVDVSGRRNAALKLSNYVQPPPEVMRRLGRDVIEVADPILRRSNHLTDDELLGIAGDLSMSGAGPPIVPDRQQPDAGGVAEPPGALAGGRAAGTELSEAFIAANAAERRLILLNLHYAPLAAAKPPLPHTALEASLKLESAALAHKVDLFGHELARALGISPTEAARLAADESGEPIVIAARALGMRADIFQRILLCLNPAIGQSVRRVYELVDLYEQLKPEAALRMLAIWQAVDSMPKPPVYQPQYHDDERSRRAGTARPDARPLPAPAIRGVDRRLPKSTAPDPRASTKRNWR